MTLSEVRATFDRLKVEYGEDSPFCVLFDALLDITEQHADREQQISARLDHLTDLTLARTDVPDTLPHDWTDSS